MLFLSFFLSLPHTHTHTRTHTHNPVMHPPTHPPAHTHTNTHTPTHMSVCLWERAVCPCVCARARTPLRVYTSNSKKNLSDLFGGIQEFQSFYFLSPEITKNTFGIRQWTVTWQINVHGVSWLLPWVNTLVISQWNVFVILFLRGLIFPGPLRSWWTFKNRLCFLQNILPWEVVFTGSCLRSCCGGGRDALKCTHIQKLPLLVISAT